jgi:hypothetical protein|uniref:Uncharacterized protein n=1 Tax=Haptolina ericina TaxID=156174 RepID=A0A7S3APJ9_9EUKA|mmetsp:Transcript_27955/g.63226  ORF Transcript_27955/g.63226 Transcript_27955/m.63226 type:complete len:236 (+) Transcript_27955:65-772(+)
MDTTHLPSPRWPRASFEVDEEAALGDSSEEEQVFEQASECAPLVVERLREAMGSLHHCLYPHGTVAIATEDELHEFGLGLDSSPAGSNAFTVHRESYGGEYDVVVFSKQPRTTMVCFPNDQQTTDAEVAMRARALLLRDIAWCDQRSSDSDASSNQSVGDSATAADSDDPASGLPGNLEEALLAVPRNTATRERWALASAPELDELQNEIIGTREQVLACLHIQKAVRATYGRRH